jgi:hypothetical protein
VSMAPGRLTTMCAYAGAAVVGAVAAVVSFGHLRSVALSAGEGELAAALLPVSVDGLLISAAAVMVADKQAKRTPRMSARVAFGIGCIATVAGNVASATPTPLGWAVAAWAPLALLLVTEMLVRRGRALDSEAAGQGSPVEAADVTGTAVVSSGAAAEPSGTAASGPTGTNDTDTTTPARETATRTGMTSTEKITAALVRQPDASVTDLVRLTSLSERTVRRRLPAARNGA